MMGDLSAVYAAVAALATAVGILFRSVKSTADECAADRRALWDALLSRHTASPPPPPPPEA